LGVTLAEPVGMIAGSPIARTEGQIVPQVSPASALRVVHS
jgi:hypothetical protein